MASGLALPRDCAGCAARHQPPYYTGGRGHIWQPPQARVEPLVPGERFELPTNGLQNRCSTAELTRQINALEGKSSRFVLTASPRPSAITEEGRRSHFWMMKPGPRLVRADGAKIFYGGWNLPRGWPFK